MKNIFFWIAILLSSLTFAQVGINTDEPNPNTALHISEKMKSSDPAVNNKIRGIIIPRLTEAERNTLTYSDAPTNTTVRLTPSDSSLMIFNTTENCYNFWNIEEETWKSVCGNLGNAKFTFLCTDVSVKGNYVKDKETDITNYIEIKNVNITKPGAYVITATSTPFNGYSFSGQGTFPTAGTQTVRIYAQGTPTSATTHPFDLTSSGGPLDPCTQTASVEPDIASYALNCATVSVTGQYYKGTPLVASNTITVVVNVSALGSYNISTKVVNGISFKASGVFTSTGTQIITLVGSGTPTLNADFDVEIVSNSVSGNTTCSATIPITLPAMTYGVIGADNVYSWHPNNVRAKAFNNTSFGPSGKVRMVSFTNSWNTNSATTAVTNLNLASKPDVILYFSFGLSVTAELATALNNYVNAGGVLIFGTADDDFAGTNRLLNGIFGEQNAERQIAGDAPSDDDVYMINNLQNDPLVNGPFGNTAGKYWGEDNASIGTIIVRQLPANSVQIASANNQFSKMKVNPMYSTVWYNNSKNFVYFGDSVGATETDTNERAYPAYYNNGVPLIKRYGGYPSPSTQMQFVYNSVLELNAVAWAIRKAAVSGINPH